MWIRKVGENLDQIPPQLEMGIALKFTETNLFFVKMDYLCTFLSIIKLFTMLGQGQLISFFRFSHICIIIVNMSLNIMLFSSKS